MNNKKIKYNKEGFTIFIALIVISVSLIVGVGLANLVAKEIEFSSVSQRSQIAFYAADTGVECALYWDLNIGFPEDDTVVIPPGTTCNNYDLSGATVDTSGYPPAVTTSFELDFTDSCVSVVIEKNVPANPTPTRIESRGRDRPCSSSDPNRIERSLEVTY